MGACLVAATATAGELRLDCDRYGISVDGGPREEIEWVLGFGYRW